MSEKLSETARATRVRRARREDISVLVEITGGPPAGRIRALRRLLKTLAADVYVVDRRGSLDGVVAIHYRRSLARGGLIATIDAMASLRHRDDEIHEDLALLVAYALRRAGLRGCVAIDCTVATPEVRNLLDDNGFEAGPRVLARCLRSEEEEG